MVSSTPMMDVKVHGQGMVGWRPALGPFRLLNLASVPDLEGAPSRWIPATGEPLGESTIVLEKFYYFRYFSTDCQRALRPTLDGPKADHAGCQLMCQQEQPFLLCFPGALLRKEGGVRECTFWRSSPQRPHTTRISAQLRANLWSTSCPTRGTAG